MPFAKGQSGNPKGRQVGQLGKKGRVEEACKKVGIDVFVVLAEQAAGKMKCNVCRGTGKTRYQPAHGETGTLERKCQSCYGSGFEKISPKDRGWAAAELAQYLEAKRKAIEVTGEGGGPLQASVTVRFVSAETK